MILGDIRQYQIISCDIMSVALSDVLTSLLTQLHFRYDEYSVKFVIKSKVDGGDIGGWEMCGSS